MPAIGAVTVASAIAFFERRDLRVGGGDARAGGVDLFAAASRRAARATALARRADPIARALRAAPSPRRAASPHRRAACASPSSSRAAPRSARRRLRAAASSASAARDVGLRRGELRFGLADVLDARAGAEQPQLRVGLIALGLRAGERELGVGGVEPRDEVAGLDAIAFGDAELEQAAADLRGDLHVGGLDLPRDADAVGGRLVARTSTAARDQER